MLFCYNKHKGNCLSMGDNKKRTDSEYARDLAEYFGQRISNEARGIIGEGRAKKMMYNAAMLVMAGGGMLAHAKYIFWCYLNVNYVMEKLKYVEHRDVYDYWTKEVPEMMSEPRANDVVEVFNGEFKKIANKVMISADSSLQTFIKVRVYRDMRPLHFVARIREYTPDSDPKKMDVEDFGCVDEVIVAPDGTKIINNRERTRGALKDYVYQNYDDIMRASELQAPLEKDGRQKLITINIDGADFGIVGNTSNKESKKAYEKIKADIKAILESANS